MGLTRVLLSHFPLAHNAIANNDRKFAHLFTYPSRKTLSEHVSISKRVRSAVAKAVDGWEAGKKILQ